MAFAHSSVIVNTGATLDTRARDQLAFPFLSRPQVMTAYVRFVWLAGDITNDLFVLQVGNNIPANPRFVLDITGGNFRVIHINATGSNVSSTTSAAALAYGDTVEMRGTLLATGSVQVGVSRNGAAEVAGSPSGALLLPEKWATVLLMVNSSGTAVVNFCAYRNIEIVAGIRTMQEMRARAGIT